VSSKPDQGEVNNIMW